MATVLKTVKPSGGGDYTTLSGFLTDAALNSTTSDPWWAECYSGNLGTATIAGWLDPPTAEGHRVKIYAADGHQHLGSFTAKSARITTSTLTTQISVQHSFITIDGLLLSNPNNGSGVQLIDAADEVRLENLLVESTHGSNTKNGISVSAGASESITNIKIINTIVRGFDYQIRLETTNATGTITAFLYQCVAYGGSAGISWSETVGSVTFTAENCAAGSSTDADFEDATGGATVTANNNLSEDDTADDHGGSNHLVNQTMADVFIEPSTGNFKLKKGSNAINAGKDLSGTVDEDVRGVTRPYDSTYDIGAFEATSQVEQQEEDQLITMI